MTATQFSPPDFSSGLTPASALRAAISDTHRIAEPALVAELLGQARLPLAQAKAARAQAMELARRLRADPGQRGRPGLVQKLLQEYALSSQEGVALMCLAEALLRIPDSATRDALIRDKIGVGEWRAHLGHSGSLFVNAATWGLLLTGQLVRSGDDAGLLGTLGRLISRGSEGLVRAAVDAAVRMMGEQFVSGETIAAALIQGQPLEALGFRHSYDMLGEAALTAADAGRYRQSYAEAIDAIGQAAAGRGVHQGPGISIKLSALHPRYCRAQRERVLAELYPVLLDLARQAARHDIGLSIDAEESERLELSLDLLEGLCRERELRGWAGLGFVIQAYQKRCPSVIDHLIDLAESSGRRLMVRLVKGAYWDSEIKRAQIEGLDYPVYTRKAHTDLAYLACARRLLAAPAHIFPQFATHNAHTVAAIHQLAAPHRWTPLQYEFQCLHGMGEPLYRQVVGADGLDRPCRIYAPVGAHETLLAYLVRRLLENGANSSFVHRIADPSIALSELIEDPVEEIEQRAAREGGVGLPHPAIPAPGALFGAARRNSRGFDLASDRSLLKLAQALHENTRHHWQAAPLLAGTPAVAPPAEVQTSAAVRNPADRRDVVGRVYGSTPASVALALELAARGEAAWAAVPAAERAACLDRAADRVEQQLPQLVALLVREAGKTCANGIAEVREAVDFLRHDAAQLRREFDNATHRPLGTVVCISPWNFPLAIFVGQIAAALAAGNVVLAKPAEQTPLIAAQLVQLLWQSGVPPAALQLLPGSGEEVGAALVADPRVQAVVFTGSTAVAHSIQQTLAQRLDRRGRPPVLIAETGGQNAMIVDSSALPEQAVADILASAFDSAGQRCSALRLLCVQEEMADRLLTILRGAMAELRIDVPSRLASDIGPVIDDDALAKLQQHLRVLQQAGLTVETPVSPGPACAHGCFLAPTLVELDQLQRLEQEVFGPVLHVLPYRRESLPALIEAINRLGYGLTMGIHTRIADTENEILAHARVGNIYVNRNMVGAVVGVQPFGGEGLSGTGPKAGGPLYLYRLLADAPADRLALATAGLRREPTDPTIGVRPTLEALRTWAVREGRIDLAALCARHAGQAALLDGGWLLDGPTGEQNRYQLHPRRSVLCLAENPADLLVQLAAVLAAGAQALWPATCASLRADLPETVAAAVRLVEDWMREDFDLLLHHGTPQDLLGICRTVAARTGRIVPVEGLRSGESLRSLERLLVERSVSINTAAAGGNASLMTAAG